MSHRFGRLGYSLAVACLAFLCAPIVAFAGFVERVSSAWPSVAALRPAIERIALALGLAPAPFAYAGPESPASLRHEAGTHRRSAARNI